MRAELAKALNLLLNTAPQAYAFLYGSEEYPDINGAVYLYPLWDGTLVAAEVTGLPFMEASCSEKIFGFHIHEGGQCQGTPEDPFADTGSHYNPQHCDHPQHAGDFPPLFGNNGYALSIFYTNRFRPHETHGHTVVIHGMPDDFKTQPSGDSGMKIACGVLQVNEPLEQD
ncbi:MAG: superoxide dismutase family protein [Eubacteriales bacterium]|nr:superoxide dismutase family protein [Eubacteriales bacterium]